MCWYNIVNQQIKVSILSQLIHLSKCFHFEGLDLFMKEKVYVL